MLHSASSSPLLSAVGAVARQFRRSPQQVTPTIEGIDIQPQGAAVARGSRVIPVIGFHDRGFSGSTRSWLARAETGWQTGQGMTHPDLFRLIQGIDRDQSILTRRIGVGVVATILGIVFRRSEIKIFDIINLKGLQENWQSCKRLLPPAYRAVEGSPAGLNTDPAAAGGTSFARAAVASTANPQPPPELCIINHSAPVAHESDGGLEEVRCLGRKWRKRLLRCRCRWKRLL